MTFVVVGGGPTGVELAGALGEIAHDTLRRDFRAIRPGETKIVLVEALDRILPPYPPDRSRSAQRQLEHLGVDVRTRTRVVDISERSVKVVGPDGTEAEIPARTVLWAAGVTASSFAKKVAMATGAETDRAGRVIVGPDLTIPGHPEIFVIGDAAVQPWKPGHPTPGVAQGAIQGGKYAAAVIRRRILRRPVTPFRYSDRGDVAVIGRLAGRHQHRLARAVRAAERLPRVGALAGDPHPLPDRVLQPAGRAHPLGLELPDPRAGDAADHRHGPVAADRGARAAGPRADRARGPAGVVLAAGHGGRARVRGGGSLRHRIPVVRTKPNDRRDAGPAGRGSGGTRVQRDAGQDCAPEPGRRRLDFGDGWPPGAR